MELHPWKLCLENMKIHIAQTQCPNSLLMSWCITQSKPGWPFSDIFLMLIIHRKKHGTCRKI